jgi:hypothetical protein
MQIKKLPPHEKEEEDQTTRDLELENIMGNLMIAQYQVDKLRSRLGERLSRGSRYYSSLSNKKKYLLMPSNVMANGIRFQLK